MKSIERHTSGQAEIKKSSFFIGNKTCKYKKLSTCSLKKTNSNSILAYSAITRESILQSVYGFVSRIDLSSKLTVSLTIEYNTKQSPHLGEAYGYQKFDALHL